MISMLVMGVLLVVGLVFTILFVAAKLVVLALAIPFKLLGIFFGLIAAVIACIFVVALGAVLIPFLLLFAVPIALVGGLVWLLTA